jgi:hypothetical protein
VLKSLSRIVRKLTEPAYFRLVLVPRARCRQRARVKAIRQKGKAQLTFIVSSMPMWRFQNLYDLLSLDPRFSLEIALYPFPSYSTEQQVKSMEELRKYFTQKGMHYLDLSREKAPGTVLREQANPDILFYPQPYDHLFWNDLDNQYFGHSLICYIPYAMLTSSGRWAYRTLLCDTAWRLFYSSEARRKEAMKVLYNGGRNIRVTGEMMSDVFSAPARKKVWKEQETEKKKIIWAPHYSLIDKGMMHRDSFTWLSGFMWELAGRYRDKIQFAFKPHPRLLTELYDHPDWGQEKADAYYRQWAEGANTQLETGPYTDLFKESDAMIHDCGSFSVEYHFTGNPVLFTTKDVQAAIGNQNELGRDGILAHYLGGSEEEIVAFIEDVVLGGKDPKKEERQAYYQKYLCPPGGHSVAENIYNEILKGIGFNG